MGSISEMRRSFIEMEKAIIGLEKELRQLRATYRLTAREIEDRYEADMGARYAEGFAEGAAIASKRGANG